MGQRYEKNRNSVSENKETRRRIGEEGKTLSEEFASLQELSGMIDSLDDDIADSVRKLETVQVTESERLVSEQEQADAEKERITADINSEINKLDAGVSKLDQLRSFEFGQKSVDAAEKTYRTEISQFKELLDELEDDDSQGFKSGGAESSAGGFEGAGLGELHEFMEEDRVNLTDVPPLPRITYGSNNFNSIVSSLGGQGVSYRQIEPARLNRSSEEIVANLSGGDLTQGSCSSLALAYAGNRAGYNVLDFRDGESRSFFSSRSSIRQIATLPGVRSAEASGRNDLETTHNLIDTIPSGKEFYFATGQHAAIVRNNNGQMQYLELQHPSNGNGWHDLDDYVLMNRFGASPNHTVPFSSHLIEVDSLANNQEFLNILGYINTAESEQRKGVSGNVR